MIVIMIVMSCSMYTSYYNNYNNNIIVVGEKLIMMDDISLTCMLLFDAITWR